MVNFIKEHRYKITIISLLISIVLLGVGLFTTNELKPVYIILGELFCLLGIFLNIKKDYNKRGFEVVCIDKRKHPNVNILLPQRSTKGSAAYDFFACDNYIVQPNEIIKIWTDVKSYMQDDEVLIINVRSSMGGKFMLANTQGWIDNDYYSNPDNDGNVGVFLKNISNETQVIERGSRIAQGIFVKYLITDNDSTTSVRKGGFGSTGK